MRLRRLFFLLYGVSGCAALVYEVVWTRLLTLHLGHTVAAVSTVLAAFMGGMAAGAIAGGRLAARCRPVDAIRLYAWLELAIALCATGLPVALTGPGVRGGAAEPRVRGKDQPAAAVLIRKDLDRS